MSNFDPITLAVLLALMALMPTLVVVSTSFLKIAVVMSLLRNALGVQQMPPNLALYGMKVSDFIHYTEVGNMHTIIGLLLRFAQRNRGMTRVLIGDALVNEHERLQTRINALLDKIEAAMKQALRIAATQENLKPDADFGALANLLRCYAVGRWEQYARSGFSREPLAQWPQQWPMLYFACLSQSGAPGA